MNVRFHYLLKSVLVDVIATLVVIATASIFHPFILQNLFTMACSFYQKMNLFLKLRDYGNIYLYIELVCITSLSNFIYDFIIEFDYYDEEFLFFNELQCNVLSHQL